MRARNHRSLSWPCVAILVAPEQNLLANRRIQDLEVNTQAFRQFTGCGQTQVSHSCTDGNRRQRFSIRLKR